MRLALIDEETKLERELSEIGTVDPNDPGSFTPNVPEPSSGEEESASEATVLGDTMAVAEELKSALKDVVGALKRIEKGTYGNCKYCKEKIDDKRLLARPSSSSCIKCKKSFMNEV